MKALVLLLAALGTALPALGQRHYRDLVYPPLRDLTVPPIEPIELPNGLVLYLLEDHSLPKVEGRMLVRTGSRLEPAEKAGLASTLGQVLRTGGSTTRPGEEVDRLLENAGAAVETDISMTSATASLFALPEHLPMVLEILAEIVRSPALPEDKIELAKVQERTGIARRNDDVGAIAAREFQRLLYGSDSPYARIPEYATIEAITREDLVEFHRRYFVPNQSLLGLWGDFDASEVRTLVERSFGSWERVEIAAAPAIPAADRSREPIVALIRKDDVNQTQLRLGHLGGRVSDPDYFALSVMAEILGGGFSSRLFQTVRSQRGLAYHASASWHAAYDYPGTFVVASSTKSETTVEAIRVIRDEIERITRDPVGEDELRLAKDGILNSFVFNFDSKGEIVSRLLTYDYYGYPRDFLDDYQENVERVSAEDVLRVAKAHVHPEALIVLAAGRADDFDAPLSTLGEVREVDIAIPEPPTEPQGGGDPARGAEALSRFVASGGEALAELRGFSLEGESQVETPQGKLPARFHVVFAGPDRYRESTVLPFGEIVTVVKGGEAWASTPRGVRELDPDQKRRARETLYRHYLGLLWAAENHLVAAEWLPSEEVLLEVDGLRMRGRFDAGTGRLLALTLPGTSFEGAPVEERREFAGFENGAYPTEVRIFHDGRPAAVTHIAKVTLNPEEASELWVRP